MAAMATRIDCDIHPAVGGTRTTLLPYLDDHWKEQVVSRAIDNEWGYRGVHSSSLYYPLVRTPMIEGTSAYHELPTLTADEAAGWMITAAQFRPARIAPRLAVLTKGLDSVSPRFVNFFISLRERPVDNVSAPVRTRDRAARTLRRVVQPAFLRR